MNEAKEYLYKLGITNDPEKSLFVKQGDAEYDMAQVMIDFAKLIRPLPTRISGLVAVPFQPGMETGYIVGATYYPISGPTPRSMDRQLAIQTTCGPVVVASGNYLVKNRRDLIVDVIGQADYERNYR